MISNIDSPESQGLLKGCALLERMKQELKGVPSMSGEELATWNSRNEVRLAELLLFAEQMHLGTQAYEAAKSSVCMLHKPLTGAVKISEIDLPRISALLTELEDQSFCCWMI